MRFVHRFVRQHGLADDVANGENMRHIGAHLDIDGDETAVSDLNAGSLRMHVCWGNYEDPHDHVIGIEKIMPIIFKAKPDMISFEAANPRHQHEWAVWGSAKIPVNKILMLGMLDTSTNFVEHPELVAQRIERFTNIVGRDRVIASTDCGFGTFASHGKVEPGIAYKKLKSLTEGATIASKRLWK